MISRGRISFGSDLPLPESDSGSETASPIEIFRPEPTSRSDRRKLLLSDAADAIAQTQQALKALEDKKNDAALKALAEATGKLELIVARDPALKLAPVATAVVTFDVFADLQTVKLAIAEAKKALSDGDLPRARPLVEALASEAQALTEKKDRSTGDNDKLANQLKTVREQLQMAELLGYGKKHDFQPMYAQLESIEKTSAGGKSGAGWFDKIRKQIADAF